MLFASALGAQETQRTALSPRTPVSIGNFPNVNGLRINFRDQDLERVNGVNITVWTPYDPSTGVVKGVAFGVPATGAGSIVGLGTGIAGVGASKDLVGLMIAPIGAGAGGVTPRRLPGGVASLPYGMAVDDQDRIWVAESNPSKPNRLVGFDPRTQKFFSISELKDDRNTIRYMIFDKKSRQIWYGSDAGFIGRADVAGVKVAM